MAPFLIAPGNRQQIILCVDIDDRRFFRRDDLDETAFVPLSLLWLACCLYASIAAAAVIRLEPARVFDGEALQLLQDRVLGFEFQGDAPYCGLT